MLLLSNRWGSAIVDQVIWELEPHTEAKHDILRRYLAAWFPIMAGYVQKSGGNRLVYIDGFAGPGVYSRKDGSTVDGSPIHALNTLRGHKLWAGILAQLNYTFLLIEADSRRADHLRDVLSRVSMPNNIKVKVEPGEFERVLSQLLDELQDAGGVLAPAFVFIDPFGPAGFPMELIHRVIGYRASEVLITLNLRALNQWYLPVGERHSQVDMLYGGQEWRQCMDKENPDTREECLRQTYHVQLRKTRNVLVRDFRMVNRHNQTAYYLVYGTHHPKGLAVMKTAMRGVDPSGAFTYSDVTNPNQPFLFGGEFDEVHARDYARSLRKLNAGKIMSYGRLKRATEEDEHYVGSDLTRALEILVAEYGVIPSSGKRGRGWPASTEFSFPPLLPQ